MLFRSVDVRELDPEVLWRRVGLVPQKPYLFSGTVASNLRYGKPDATDAELWEALQIAQARDFGGALEARELRRPLRDLLLQPLFLRRPGKGELEGFFRRCPETAGRCSAPRSSLCAARSP